METFSEDFRSRFAGVARLFGADAFQKIAAARVCLVGLGGVGSWTCEALARSGIRSITLADTDEIQITNTNRQLHALDGAYGRAKADALAERVRAINPECEISAEKLFITRENADAFFEKRGNAPRFDIVADAIDGAANKAALIAASVAAGTPVVSSGGCAGKSDGTRVEYGDLADADGDALLRCVRRELRSRYGFPKNGARMGVPVVFSRERSREPAPLGDAFPQMISPAGGKPRPGTAAWVTGAFGLALAQLVLEKIAAAK